MKTKLDVLNERLAQVKGLPEHKRSVTQSFANLQWLKKHLRTEDTELKRLLGLPQAELLKPYE